MFYGRFSGQGRCIDAPTRMGSGIPNRILTALFPIWFTIAFVYGPQFVTFVAYAIFALHSSADMVDLALFVLFYLTSPTWTSPTWLVLWPVS